MHAAGYMSLAHRITEVLLASLCQCDSHDGSIGDCHHDCIFRQCNLCGVDMLCATLESKHPNLDMDKKVSWHQWVMIYDCCTGKKQDYSKYRFTGSQSELHDLFLKKVAKMAGHLFNFK